MVREAQTPHAPVEPGEESARLRVASAVAETSQPPEHVELLRRIANDDDAALRVFYRRYSGLVYSLARRILRDDARAEEVLQETFIRVWRAAITYDPARGSPETWVVTIARNLAFSALRQRKEVFLAEAAAEELPAEDAQTDPEEAAWQSARRSLVRKAIVQLPAHQRRVVLLFYFDGLTHGEIAARTGQPLGTVKSRLRLALRHLNVSLHTLTVEPTYEPGERASDAVQKPGYPQRGVTRSY